MNKMNLQVNNHSHNFSSTQKNLKIRKYLLSVFVIIALVIPNLHGSGQSQIDVMPPGGAGHNADSHFDHSERLTNQIIVKFTELDKENRTEAVGITDANRFSTTTGIEMTYVREMSGEAHIFSTPSMLTSVEIAHISKQISTLPEVAYAEPDSLMSHTLLPNDPLYPQQWHYFEPSSNNYGINMPPAWGLINNSPGGLTTVVVAVIDTGITQHIEFTGQTVPGYDFISDPRIANDGDGRDNDPSDPGDWITSAESASGFFAGCRIRNSSWHGSHVAGTIAAVTNNGIGVAGINWHAKILPVRVLGKCGGFLSDVVDGMRWAAGLAVPGVPANLNPARVLNLSLGGTGDCGDVYQSAINDINAVGATVVVAAGNNSINANGFRPANCNGVISVAATNRSGSKAWYSNFGGVIDISAPGGDFAAGILSTSNTGTQGPISDSFAWYQGTSMAAPHVSGVVSLLYTLNATLRWHQVRQILRLSVTPFPSGSTCNTTICGSGILNAHLAIQKLMPEDQTIYLPLIIKGGAHP